MRTTTSLKRGLAKVRREQKAGRYDNALAETAQLLQSWPDNPHLLVLRAELIQLQETENAPGLDEAKADLQCAVALDQESPAALIELGHFLLAVDDDAKGAAQCFEEATRLCKRLLKDALLGKAEALVELERQPEALACLAEARWLQGENGKSSRRLTDEEILERVADLRHAESPNASRLTH